MMKNGLHRSKYDQNNLEYYFSQVKTTKLLSEDEEIALAKAIEKGNEDARQKLIQANLRLVIKIAFAYSHSGSNLLDLIQEGNIGLIKAASRYDYRKEVRFSTYAAWWIKQSIIRALASGGRLIRLPIRKEEALRKMEKLVTSRCPLDEASCSVDEIAEETGLQKKDIILLLKYLGNMASFDSDLSDTECTLHEILADTTYCPDKDLLEQDLKEQTKHILNELPEREREILRYRFEFYNGKKYSLKNIGKKMGLSPETVRQIEIKAIQKLRTKASRIRDLVYA